MKPKENQIARQLGKTSKVEIMTIYTKEAYEQVSLDYYLDSDNPADCKFTKKIGCYEIMGLQESADQFMITKNECTGTLFCVDTTLDEVETWLVDKSKDEVENDVVNYFGGLGADGYSDEQRQIMAIYNREWDSVECDSEGPNGQQEKLLDDIVEEFAKKVIEEKSKILGNFR